MYFCTPDKVAKKFSFTLDLDQENLLVNDCRYLNYESFADELLHKSSCNLHLAHFNIVSLLKYFDKLNQFLSQLLKKLHVICLGETRLEDHNLKHAYLPGYKLYHRNSNTSAGGAAIFVVDSLNVKKLNNLNLGIANVDAWLEISDNTNKSLIVGTICRHSHNDLGKFECAFVKTIKSMKAKQKYLVFGDFNINSLKVDSSAVIDNYFNHLRDWGCIQLIDKPTRVSQSSSTVIDHIYTNSTLLIAVEPAVMYHDMTYHLPIFANYKCLFRKNKVNRQLILKLQQDKVEPFLIELERCLTEEFLKRDFGLKNLLGVFTKLTSRFFPITTPSRNQSRISKNPWITKGLPTSIRHKNKLCAKCLATKNPDSLSKYKKYQNRLTHIKQASKRHYCITLFSSSNSAAETWKHINHILRNRNQPSLLPESLDVRKK